MPTPAWRRQSGERNEDSGIERLRNVDAVFRALKASCIDCAKGASRLRCHAHACVDLPGSARASGIAILERPPG
jgi:hypothetical protein